MPDLSERVLLIEYEYYSESCWCKIDVFFTGDLVSLSEIGTFMIRLSTYLYFPKWLGGLRPGTFFSTVGIFMIFILFIFGDNLSCVTLFDDPNREYLREPIYMTGE